ncbi:MAG: aspartate/glutamate racemase family protein [Halothermotrichaceae bacterium]
MPKKLALISTDLGVANELKNKVNKLESDIDTYNYVDDTIVSRIMNNQNKLNSKIIKSVVMEVISAEKAGADLILITCSSISEVVDIVQPLVDVPVLKIDQPMANKAVENHSKIGVIATLQTTIRPTIKLVKNTAQLKEKNIEILDTVCEGAFEILTEKNDPETHDKIVQDAIKNTAKRADVIILAQASMARAVNNISVDIPVLTSPESGLKNAINILKNK